MIIRTKDLNDYYVFNCIRVFCITPIQGNKFQIQWDGGATYEVSSYHNEEQLKDLRKMFVNAIGTSFLRIPKKEYNQCTISKIN